MAMDDDQAIADSLEKYRPHNFEFGSNKFPVESSDINDIRDFYANIGTRNRALNRFGMAPDLGSEGAIRKTSLPATAYRPFEDQPRTR